MLEEYSDFLFSPMLPEDDEMDNLQNYTFENRPAVLSRMTKEDFEILQKEMPYFYVDENGELHFISLPEIDPELKKFAHLQD